MPRWKYFGLCDHAFCHSDTCSHFPYNNHYLKCTGLSASAMFCIFNCSQTSLKRQRDNLLVLQWQVTFWISVMNVIFNIFLVCMFYWFLYDSLDTFVVLTAYWKAAQIPLLVWKEEIKSTIHVVLPYSTSMCKIP